MSARLGQGTYVAEARSWRLGYSKNDNDMLVVLFEVVEVAGARQLGGLERVHGHDGAPGVETGAPTVTPERPGRKGFGPRSELVWLLF